MRRMNFLLAEILGAVVFCLAAPPLSQAQVVGVAEFPATGAHLFGVDFFSGWVCNVAQVTFAIDGGPQQQVAYGGGRVDTAIVCGDSDDGYAGVFNWALLSPGDHEFCIYGDGVEVGCATVTVSNAGSEFILGSDKIKPLGGIPERGTTLFMQWDATRQRPVVVDVRIK